ncbi:hypothetical protein PVAP13_8KG207402 [Panicum virgatum]|uniref:Uncharacterized protein n=1 Tax=Panicum virgatum TaxID=38727 RepID=A0A8T0PJZ8_PANVG|nr:hypothetical protein PVAP13_8KG207402 [Panicum virgatum]
MEAPRYLSNIFPQEAAGLSWIPDGMDPNSSYRLAVHVGAYVKINDDGSREYCEALSIAKILDRDISNWDDMLNELATDINLGCNHKLRVTYWDKMSRNYEEITSDQKLLHAIDMYWEIRRLSLQVCVIKKNDSEFMHDVGRQESMPWVLQGSTDAPAKQINSQPPLEIASPLLELQNQNSAANHKMHKMQTVWTYGKNMQ